MEYEKCMVPMIVHESAMAQQERVNKRLAFALIASFGVMTLGLIYKIK